METDLCFIQNISQEFRQALEYACAINKSVEVEIEATLGLQAGFLQHVSTKSKQMDPAQPSSTHHHGEGSSST